MGVIQRRITGESVYRAIEADGVPLIRQNWFDIDPATGLPVAACLLGTAAMNLHVAAHNDYAKNYGEGLLDQLNKFRVPEDSPWVGKSRVVVGDAIIEWFDSDDRSKPQDSEVYNNYKNTETHSRNGYPWLLQTHEEIMNMVHDLLQPLWNEEFVVDSYEFVAPNFNTVPSTSS